MPDNNRISSTLSDADKAAVIQKFGEIRALLPFLINLTPKERLQLPKLSDDGFDDKCDTYMDSNPKLVPAFVEVPEVKKDRALLAPMLDIDRELASLAQAVSDTTILIGSEIYNADLAFYQNVKQGAKRGVEDAQGIYDDLRQRFPGGNAQPATPPAPPKP